MCVMPGQSHKGKNTKWKCVLFGVNITVAFFMHGPITRSSLMPEYKEHLKKNYTNVFQLNDYIFTKETNKIT